MKRFLIGSPLRHRQRDVVKTSKWNAQRWVKTEGEDRDVNDSFQLLREQVLASPQLLARLRATADAPSFVTEVQRIAAELDLEMTATDIEQALLAARRECIETWG
jgi:hypothetical protein